MEPLITVIIPMYNAEAYISKCLESLITQTYRKIEILVVDDGSVDGSYNICKSYEREDNRLRVIHQENKGVSFARNLALSQAQGEYVVFVDADDYVGENYIRDLWEVVCITKCDLAISRYSTDINYNINKNSGLIKNFDSETAIINMLLGNGFDSSVCCKLIKLSDAYGHEFRKDLVLAEDLTFFYEIINNCSKISFVDKVNYFYVLNKSGAISQLSYNKIESMRIFDELIQECKNEKIEEALVSKYVSTCFHLLSLDNANNIDLSGIKNIIKKYRKKAIKGRYVAGKVKIACLISMLSFELVNRLLSLKRG